MQLASENSDKHVGNVRMFVTNSQISNVISLFNVLYEFMLGANFWEYVPALVGDTRLLVQDGFNNFLEANRCDTAYSCGGRGAWRSICVTGLLDVCDMAVIRMCEVSPFMESVSILDVHVSPYSTWGGAFTCGCTVMHLYIWLGAFMCVIWLIHVCEIAHWYEPTDSFICVTWLFRVWIMTHSRVWHDSFSSVAWIIHVCDMMRSCMWLGAFMFVCVCVRVTWLNC